MVGLMENTGVSLPNQGEALSRKFYLIIPLRLEMKIEQPHLARQAVVTAHCRVQTVVVAGGHDPPA